MGLAIKNIAITDPPTIKSMEAIFCGHDHVNNASVSMDNVVLSYGFSIDNLAYDSIDKSGRQRGCTTITVKPNGDTFVKHLNLYTDLGKDKDIDQVSLDDLYYNENNQSKVDDYPAGSDLNYPVIKIDGTTREISIVE